MAGVSVSQPSLISHNYTTIMIMLRKKYVKSEKQ